MQRLKHDRQHLGAARNLRSRRDRGIQTIGNARSPGEIEVIHTEASIMITTRIPAIEIATLLQKRGIPDTSRISVHV